ncbi:MAG TPA: ParB N-terminal domain-containing protein [Thermoplasmata archaeon]|nr:ParB N-terminal domain-containing protein [Thermoplasmata archaeon]
MTHLKARFALVPLAELRAHEEIEEADLPRLVDEIRSLGSLAYPIWVAEGSHVILNGHHRVAALRRLGAARAPAWLVDYHSPAVHVDRWSPGPPISKHEVERRARDGLLFPPKTTKHLLDLDLGERPTPLAELMDAPRGPADHRRTSAPSRRRSAAEPSSAR